jgi:radical SAM-linked protein
MPRISFDDPIPLGMESQAERLRIKVAPHHGCTELLSLLNPQLPSGLQFIHCRRLVSHKDKRSITEHRYHIFIDPCRIDIDALDQFNTAQQWLYERSSHKGRKRPMDLKRCVNRFDRIDDACLILDVNASQPPIARPADLLRSVFRLNEDDLNSTRVIKLAPDGLQL